MEEMFCNKGHEALNKLSREVVEAPSLEASKIRFDVSLNNLIWLKICLLIAGDLD